MAEFSPARGAAERGKLPLVGYDGFALTLQARLSVCFARQKSGWYRGMPFGLSSQLLGRGFLFCPVTVTRIIKMR